MRTRFLSIGFALGAILIAGIARAAVPSEISIQGVLRNNQGQLQTMPVDIKIEFFDAETGGTSIAGPYTKNALVVTNGLFNVQISDATLATKLGNAASVWVEVTVNNTDVFPRQKVTSEAFALRAAVAENLSCSGCVSDGMIAGVAAGKISGKVASAAAADTATTADTANGLSCTGCVTNSMISAVDGAKVMNAVATATNAAQLGGVAASSYQRALNGTGSCPANQAISGIAQAGTFACTDTVANAASATNAVNAQTATNASQLGGVAASSYQRVLSTTGAVTGAGACASGSAISGIASSGTFACTNTVANATTANGISCSGCIVRSNIASNQFSHTHAPTVAYNPVNTTQAVGPGATVHICSQCPSGSLIGGNCYTDDPDLVLVKSFNSGGTYWCCGYRNAGSVTRNATASPNCLTIATANP